MQRVLIVIVFCLGSNFALAAECCQPIAIAAQAQCRPHFFGRSHWRIRQWFDDLGLASRHLFESEQSIHMPYDSWNIYYYDRPYQFRHHETTLLPMQSLVRDELSGTYDEIQQRNEPRFGNVDALEFAVLPE